ncbi:hypothetical protein J2W55_001328 [Mucilaginibacter pocheonensis]|uniref:Uncharacterized protein n=1 Tax=Mucilaginibacter pocheonensis TaxID=398050 RepID=A0ABU1T7X2_9SPHI|nr:hypothetical protein [Mucilaginibacter pocheonensis]
MTPALDNSIKLIDDKEAYLIGYVLTLHCGKYTA